MSLDYDLEEARTANARASSALDELGEPAVAWARRKLPVLKPFLQTLARNIDQEKRGFPEGWQEAVETQLLAGALFGSPTMVSRFLRESRSELGTDAREMAESIRDEPWRYAVFELRQTLADDFHVCLDFDTREEILLQSPAVSTLSRSGCRVFLSLVFSNGACLQCYSLLHYFRSFQAYDFAAYAEAIEPQLFVQKGLSAVIWRHPELFVLLSLYAEIPPQEFRGTPLILCADWHDAEELPRVAHPARLETRSSGSLTQLALSASQPDAPNYPQHGLLFFDARGKRVMAHAMGTARYAELLEAAGPAWGFAPLPRWKAGMTMVIAMKRLLSKDEPGHEYLDRFEEKEGGEESPELKRINALLAELAKRHNASVPYVLEDLAKLYGVELETARQVEKSLTQAAAGRRGGLGGPPPHGFDGFSPPPPDTLRLFNRTLADSPLFELDGSRGLAEEAARLAREAGEAATRGGRRGEIRRMLADGRLGLDRMSRFVEEEFLRLFGLADVTVLSYTVYLLLRFGSEAREIEAYAAEILRTYQLTLAREQEPISPVSLSRTLARFFGHVLGPLGLVTTGTHGEEPSVETTPLFRKWIKLSGYWE